MQASYKRDLNHNYLILTGDESIDTESYQVRLLMAAAPSGFLRCTMQTADNRIQFYYDITALYTLADLYEHKKLNKEDIQLLFGEILKVLEEMEGYLLNCGHLILKPEYIYLDLNKQSVKFCFFPVQEKDVTHMFREITEYMLPKIDHTDQQAVMLGYSIYRRVMEDSLYIEQIKGELYREYEEASGSKRIPDNEEVKAEASELFERPEEYLFEEEAESTKYPVVPTLGIVISGLVFFGYFYFINQSQYSWELYTAVAGALIILCAIPYAVYKIQKARFGKHPIAAAEKTGQDQEADREERIEAEFWEQGGFTADQPNQEINDETVMLAPSPADKLPCLMGVYPAILQPIIINSDVFILGKLESAADVVLPSPAVSRIHAKIVKEDGYCLYDLNSRNGTRVNHKMLQGNESYKLKDGDEIIFGDLTYCFRLNV